MKTAPFLFASSALLLGIGAANVSAQSGGKPVEGVPTPKGGPPVVTGTEHAKGMHSMFSAPARASKIIGTKVVDSAGKDLAEIKDLMISDTGEVVACVERSDDMYLCVPMSKLDARLSKSSDPKEMEKDSKDAMAGMTPDIEQFAFNGDRALFEAAPAVKDMKAVDGACMKRSMDHFNGRTMTGDAKTAADPTRKEPGTVTAMAMEPGCAKKLIGMDVKGTDGESIGDVKDLAIDLGEHQVAYAIISTGGVLGVGDSLHAVAFDRLTCKADSCTIPMTKDGISKLPSLDLDRLPNNPTGEMPAHHDMSKDQGTDRKGG